ncbi:uncharacterized protein LOC126764053 isoform X3 [Bactrocera neohumeralis]|uniref:uncharacterized protein LOC126764053 isoform X3 n=1 Tax=Bactrocera neohumeralis TaxID=98809 RepID=UPI002166082E|nr:uncharacterized protein LOC126764053 isoform X3 [Bactrocera neohumeralis]
MQSRNAGEIIPSTYSQATELMDFHRRMHHNFMVLNYVAKNMIYFYKGTISNEVNRDNLWRDGYDGMKNSVEGTLNNVAMLKYKLWLLSNYNNRTGRFRRFSNDFHNRHQELDTINITGYALYQHPHKFEKLDANSIILLQSASPNAVMDEERIEEIRRRKRSPINILLKLDIIAQKSLRLLKLFSSTSDNYSCYYYLICENSDIARNQITDHAFWIPIWRFLATGASFASLAFSFRLGKSTVGAIVKETTQVLWDNMFTIHMPQPNEQCFQEIAKQYWKLWNFPNCIGAIDGKHIRINCPGNTGCMYYNYKHFFSIVLQGIADANCKFIAVEVGGYGKQSDGGTFSSSKIFNLLKSGELPVPGNTCLPNSEEFVPYVFLGDEAYPLLECLLRPYSQKEITEDHEYFNARLSRAGKCIECAFGLLSARFRILWKPIETDPLFAELIVKCICLIHNIIIDLEGLDENLKEEVQKEHFEKIIKEFNKTSVKNGRLIRDKFCNFVCMNKI